MTSTAAAAIYVALNLLLLVILAARVTLLRRSAGISLGTGGDAALERRVRAHGNAAENMPLFLLALFMASALGLAPWMVHAFGASFTLARLAQAYGVSAPHMTARKIGTSVSWLTMALLAVALFYQGLT